MHRLVFYGFIILAIVLLVAFVNVIIYWLLRICLTKHAAHVTSWCIVLAMFVITGISVWWGHTHTRLQIEVKQVDVVSPRVPEAFDGYRIAQISDFHLNSFESEEGRDFIARLAQSMQEQQPDLIVFTGDLVTIRSAEGYPFRESLAKLSHIQRRDNQGEAPVYSILGNHDYADYMRNFDQERRVNDVDSLIALQEGAGWHMLKNTSVLLSATTSSPDTLCSSANAAATQSILLVGVENIGEPPFSVYGDLNQAMAEQGGLAAADSLFTVLLSHNPTHWRSEVLPQTRIDLTLSGHTHATQFKVGSFCPSKWKYDEYMGLYDADHSPLLDGQPYAERQTSVNTPQYLYVNTGLGCVGPAVRVGVKPEVTILTLRRP